MVSLLCCALLVQAAQTPWEAFSFAKEKPWEKNPWEKNPWEKKISPFFRQLFVKT